MERGGSTATDAEVLRAYIRQITVILGQRLLGSEAGEVPAHVEARVVAEFRRLPRSTAVEGVALQDHLVSMLHRHLVRQGLREEEGSTEALQVEVRGLRITHSEAPQADPTTEQAALAFVSDPLSRRFSEESAAQFLRRPLPMKHWNLTTISLPP